MIVTVVVWFLKKGSGIIIDRISQDYGLRINQKMELYRICLEAIQVVPREVFRAFDMLIEVSPRENGGGDSEGSPRVLISGVWAQLTLAQSKTDEIAAIIECAVLAEIASRALGGIRSQLVNITERKTTLILTDIAIERAKESFDAEFAEEADKCLGKVRV